MRVESWLKRYAPHGIGSFAVEVESFKDENSEWHIKGFKPTTNDPVLEEKGKQRDILSDLIKENPDKSQRQLAKLAAARGIGRDKTEQLLKAGIGKYWAVSEGARGRLIYELLDGDQDN